MHAFPILSIEEYDSWMFKMENHLSSLISRMMAIIQNRPILIYHTNPGEGGDAAHPAGDMVLKCVIQMDAGERKLYNLDLVARNTILKIFDNVVLLKIHYCTTINAMWDILVEVCEGNDQIKESKLQTAMTKFENLRMLPSETIDQLDGRFTAALDEIFVLGKEFTDKEINYTYEIGYENYCSQRQ